jgi:hypothetical protein
MSKTEKTIKKVNTKDKKIDVVVDTPKVDVEIHVTEEKKEFKLDTEKLDVNVVKTEEGTSVTVNTKTPLLKVAGKLISKIFVKKFNK